MTAEFAVLLPAVALVLAFCLAAVQVVTLQVRLTDAAADAARSLARGDGPDTAAGRAAVAVPGSSLAVERTGDAVCAVLAAPAGSVALLAAVRVSARSCAIDGGF